MKIISKLTCLILLELTSLTLYSHEFTGNCLINGSDLTYKNDMIKAIQDSSIHQNRGIQTTKGSEENQLYYPVRQSVSTKSTSSLDIIEVNYEVPNDWKIINPKPSYLTGRDIYFLNENVGFIINDKVLLKTTDKGENWNEVMTVSFANRIVFENSIGYIIGNSGTIYKSTYNGVQWNKLSTTFTENLNAISLITEDTLRITCENKLFSSNDGGLTWETHPIDGVIVYDSYFTSANVGHAACDNGTILKTVDGGINWNTTINSNMFPSGFLNIVFANDTIGFAWRETQELFKTTDGGETWHNYIHMNSIYDMYFLNGEIGYFSIEPGLIFKTIDYGISWQDISPEGFFYGKELDGIFFINEYEGYATGVRGGILKTENGGSSWEEYAPTYNHIRQLDFITDSIAYFLVGNEIYKTTDEGKTIINLGAPLPGQKTRQFDFIDELTGYTISGGEIGTSASENSVYKTTDGGITWTKTHDTFSVMEEIYCLDFIDNNTGFVSGGYDQPQLKKTTDGGKTWTTKGESLSFGQIQFLNPQTGYARNSTYPYQRIYKTTDGGENWEVVLNKEEGINSFHFFDERVGYTVGTYQFIYKTVDGGNNWKELKIPYENYVFVKFISRNVGFILDKKGKLYKTFNGGENWELWTEAYGINSVEIQSNKIFIYGTYGKILENSIAVDSISVHINPANSITNRSAFISGTVASNGEAIDSVVFEYSEDESFSNRIVLDTTIGFDSSAVVSTVLSQIESNTTYFYRLYAIQGGRKYYSNISSFTTLRDYEIILYPISEYSCDGAKVIAKIVSRGTATTNIEFQYGTDTLLENSVPAIPNLVLADETSYVEAQLSSLEPETGYYVQLKANYGGQDVYSHRKSFITTPEYYLDYFIPDVNKNNINIHGYLIAYKDTVTNLVIQYGKSRAYDHQAEAFPETVYKGEEQPFECLLNDLDSNEVYFYRARFIMGSDTIYGNENIINLNQELDIIMLEAEQLSDTSVIVKALINVYGNYINNIQFIYGIDGNYTDSIAASPPYVSHYNSKMVQAVINGVTPDTKYLFKISANNTLGTVYSDSLSLFVSKATDAKDYNMSAKLVVYPNPTEHFLTIECSKPISSIELLNLQGVILAKYKNSELDISEFPSGVYLIKVYTRKEFLVQKIIKN